MFRAFSYINRSINTDFSSISYSSTCSQTSFHTSDINLFIYTGNTNSYIIFAIYINIKLWRIRCENEIHAKIHSSSKRESAISHKT